jgi:antitoxin VapB
MEAGMSKTTLFHSNRSQAVRLSKDVAFPANVREVEVIRDGARRVIVPANSVWDDFFEGSGIDLGERDQPPAQIREAF